ncbi:MAG: peroxiredoxin [Coxiellaceae bacterium]|nr:peroxiredoxin [Coxiellaceae bacterium]
MSKTATLNRVVPAQTFSSTDESVSDFKSLRGKNIVLYFYPKDNTPGCTTEANDFKAAYAKLKKLNTVVLGVSRDSLASHHKFIDKFKLPFPLIADTEESLCRCFDVIKPKKLYGKEYIGIERSTFFIDDKGKLKHEWRKVKVKQHVEEILTYIKSM